MCRSREQGQHPNNEEMVGDHGVHFREADGLEADAFDDLLVGEGVEELAGDYLWCLW